MKEDDRFVTKWCDYDKDDDNGGNDNDGDDNSGDDDNDYGDKQHSPCKGSNNECTIPWFFLKMSEI